MTSKTLRTKGIVVSPSNTGKSAEAVLSDCNRDQAALANIRVVLVATSHPGNIGAVARAMKTMQLPTLYLVRPKRFPCAEATARAAGADDVLFAARVCETLDEALAACGWVCATSARPRSLPWPELTPREAAARALALVQQTPVALVFGREHSGLTNTELDRCHALVRIPTHPVFRSLNLAAAVQLLAYEVHLAWRGTAERLSGSRPAAPLAGFCTADEMQGFYNHLEAALTEIGYLNPDHPKRLMRRLRRFFNRAQPDRVEMNILRGILTAVQRAAKVGPGVGGTGA